MGSNWLLTNYKSDALPILTQHTFSHLCSIAKLIKCFGNKTSCSHNFWKDQLQQVRYDSWNSLTCLSTNDSKHSDKCQTNSVSTTMGEHVLTKTNTPCKHLLSGCMRNKRVNSPEPHRRCLCIACLSMYTLR